ncbi:proteasome lid subunit RPN8/RPN11 [Paraburkholderia sp. Clong3]|uniref:Mov34/MPN/PAD-1 family protein n=1 Tax=Paraburkholderia sp. Clong3 TaxID=2991061 RepID=UPI003D2307A1
MTIPPEVQAPLIAALRRAGVRECGGVLLGEHVGTNDFAVRSLTVHQPGAVAAFVRGMGGMVKAIKTYCRSKGNDFTRFNYLGEWHSHPLFSVQPSAKDHTTMRELATDRRVGANFVVLLVFRLHCQQLEGSAHTYLPDGSVHLSKLDLEGIE